MHAMITLLVAAGLTAATARLLHWTDPFHFVTGGAALVLFGLGAWLFVRSRCTLDKDFNATGLGEDGLDGELAKTSPIRSCFMGTVLAAAALLCLGLTFAGLHRVPLVYGAFYDLDRPAFEQQIETLCSAGNHARAAELIGHRLPAKATAAWRAELARKLYACLIESAKAQPDSARRLAILKQAESVAQARGLDGQLARTLAGGAAHDQSFHTRVEQLRQQQDWASLIQLLEVTMQQRGPAEWPMPLAPVLYDTWVQRARAETAPEPRRRHLSQAVQVAGQHRLDPALATTLLAAMDSEQAGRARFTSRLEELKAQRRWPELVTLLRLELDDPANARESSALAGMCRDALVAWGDGLRDLAGKHGKYREACAVAAEYRLDASAAEARLRAVEAELVRRSAIQARVDQLRRDHAWPELTAYLLALTRDPREQWPFPYHEWLFEAALAWAADEKGLEQQQQHYRQALDIARTHNLAPDRAAAGLDGVERQLAEQARQRALAAAQLLPVNLPPGCQTGITRVSLDSFPPSLTLDVFVEDARGEAVRGLAAKDFQSICQGRPVKALQLGTLQHRAPRQNILIALDTSGSMQGAAFKAAITGAKALVQSFAGDRDAVIKIIAFSDKAHEVGEWSGDQRLLTDRLDRLQAGGQTALLDAVALATRELAQCEGARKLVLFTDGKNTVRSNARLDELITGLVRQDVAVVSLGLRTADLDATLLRQLAGRTQGTYLEAPDQSRIVDTFQSGSRLLRQHVYRLVITPEDAGSAGELALEIKVGGANAVTARHALTLPRPLAAR
jgi:uncharacterized protein YegL